LVVAARVVQSDAYVVLAMNIAIVGSRDVYIPHVRARLFPIVARSPIDATIVSGGARGVDREAARAARFYRRALLVLYADWKAHPRIAGYLRNAQIVEACSSPEDMVIALWDGFSRGTRNTLERATKAGVRTFVRKMNDE
jgi:hypothetical protein